MSQSIATPHPILTSARQKFALALAGLGAFIFLLIWTSRSLLPPVSTMLVGFGLFTAGAAMFIREEYLTRPEGIKNNRVWLSSLTARGIWGWLAAVVFTGFYVCLYWFPQFLGLGNAASGEVNTGLVALFDPLSRLISDKPADQWFVYGTFYTFAVLLMGWKFIAKYRHSRYQIIRTISVCFFQLGFAYLIPAFLKMMHQPEFYFTYFWPLKDYYGSPGAVAYFTSQGNLGMFMVAFGLLMTFVGTPILTYFFGKRWYCSWVCGCGGLAETAGDPWRQLSDKSLSAWRIERWMIHSVLIAVVVMTALLWLNSWQQGTVLGSISQNFSKTYGFVIGSLFSGVIGVGFYPLMGSRVWCRFGCPMAAYLGILQKKKSKFRITTNGGQCISCGNCSTYCEMGIDVRHYAQRGQDIVRASCVGCGICSAVCPRGVLRLENAAADIAERAEATRI